MMLVLPITIRPYCWDMYGYLETYMLLENYHLYLHPMLINYTICLTSGSFCITKIYFHVFFCFWNWSYQLHIVTKWLEFDTTHLVFFFQYLFQFKFSRGLLWRCYIHFKENSCAFNCYLYFLEYNVLQK